MGIPLRQGRRVAFNTGSSLLNRAARFNTLTHFKGFICPENDILSGPYSGSDVKSLNGSGSPQLITPMISYNTALYFQIPYLATLPSSTPHNIDPSALGQDFVVNNGYSPNINKVGNPSAKIFIADGGRFAENDSDPPDYDLQYGGSNSPGGAYADDGPWDAYSRAYGHDNTLSGELATLPITYSMRHGNRNPKAPLGAFRFNAGFFDGHVETLDGKRGLNPNPWVPTGSIVPRTECTNDAVAEYFGGQSSLRISNTPP